MYKRVDTISGWADQSISTVHHALRAPRRRLAIGLIANWPYLVGDNTEDNERVTWYHPNDDIGCIEVRTLAREIAAIEQETSTKQASGKPYHSVYTTLSQTHLPELDDVGAITYNGDRQTVTADQNILALVIAAMITSSVSQQYFNARAADCFAGGADAQNEFTD